MSRVIDIKIRGFSRGRTGRARAADPDIVFMLTAVQEKLEEIKASALEFEESGYNPDDDSNAIWEYETMIDEAVCPICRPLHGTEYTSQQLYAEFPSNMDVEPGLKMANTHEPRDPNCRCKLKLRDPEETAFNWFADRMEEKVGT